MACELIIRVLQFIEPVKGLGKDLKKQDSSEDQSDDQGGALPISLFPDDIGNTKEQENGIKGDNSETARQQEMEYQEKSDAQIGQPDIFNSKGALPQQVEVAEQGYIDDEGEIDGLCLEQGGKTIVIKVTCIVGQTILPDRIDHANYGRQRDDDDKNKEDPVLQLFPDIKQSDRNGKDQEGYPESKHDQGFLPVMREKGTDKMQEIKKDHEKDLLPLLEQPNLFGKRIV